MAASPSEFQTAAQHLPAAAQSSLSPFSFRKSVKDIAASKSRYRAGMIPIT
jgi:hypothetical protein